MSSPHFRFPNLWPQADVTFSGDLQHFLDASPELIHNPWPHLVDLSARDYGWSQPIIMGWYAPLTRPDPGLGQLKAEYLQDLLRLDARVIRFHEQIHLLLNATPVKDWMRFHIADSFLYIMSEGLNPVAASHSIGAAIGIPSESLLHGQLTHNDTELSEALNHILLAEELLATSFSIHNRRIIQDFPDYSPYGGDIDRLEDVELENQNANLGEEFTRLYSAFRKAARLANEVSDTEAIRTLVRLGIFLEPMRVQVGASLTPGNSQERCDEFAIAMTKIKDYEQLRSWLSAVIRRGNDLRNWGVVLRSTLEYHNGNKYWYDLFALVFGDNIADIMLIFNSDEDKRRYIAEALWQLSETWFTGLGQNGLNYTMFYPNEVKGTWYIVPNVPTAYYNRHLNLVALEGIRQQIVTGQGMACPFRTDDTCICAKRDPTVRDLLRRLSTHLPSGNANLAPLPPPCGGP